ncbi:MAG: HAD family hydrolase [bacterium]
MTAFFDLDRTVLDVNSGRLWIRSEVRLGYLGRRQAARAAFHLARYHLGFARIEPVIRDAVATLAGTPEAELAARTERSTTARWPAGSAPAWPASSLATALPASRALDHLVQLLAGLFQRDPRLR